MIEFEEIIYKNYLSTGNFPVVINLKEHKRTLFVGANGNGKSTMLSALFFVLFGKDIRGITKNNLINSINGKNCEVQIKFTTNGKKYKVIRGIKPNIFKIFEDDRLIDQLPDVKEYQAYFEKNILKTNFKTFKQMVPLGTDSFIPFMKLTAADRRDMVEDLLGQSVISEMADALKKKLVSLNQEISNVQNEKNVAAGKLEILVEQKKTLQQKASSDQQKLKDMIVSAQSEINGLRDIQIKLLEKQTSVDEAVAIVRGQQKEYQSLDSQMVLLDRELLSLKKNSNFFHDNDTCPTCTQKINEDHKEGIVGDNDTKIKEIERQKSEIFSKYSKLEKEIEVLPKLEDGTRKISNELIKISTQISNFDSNIMTYQKQLEDTVPVDMFDKIELGITFCQNKVSEADEQLKSLLYQKSVKMELHPMLKDDGVKAKIVENYIPVMNNMINDFLQKMEFYVQFELDSEFNEKIKSRYRDDFQYANFSAGEKQRIDLALLFTWREIARKRNSLSTNLLILDEIGDSSLDQEGVECLVKILDTLPNTNTIIISHNTETREQIAADLILEFSKNQNFTTVNPL